MPPSEAYIARILARYRPWTSDDRARLAALAGNPPLDDAAPSAQPKAAASRPTSRSRTSSRRTQPRQPQTS
jgi:hypothetical protein